MPDIREGHTACDNAAVMRGYTKEVLIEGDGCEFAALVRPDEDLDGYFKCFDTDSQEWLGVSGWMCRVTDIEEDLP